MNTFSPTEAIKFGWKTFKANPGFLIGLLVIVYVVQFGVGLITSVPGSNDPTKFNFNAGTILLGLVGNIISIILSLGLINALLQLVNTGKGNFSDIFAVFKDINMLINYVVGSIITGLIVIGGLILLIVPGIYLAIRLSQFPYFIIDKKLGAIEAIKGSWNATAGNVMNLFVFGLLCILVVIAGAIALLVGLLVAFPVVSVAAIYVYKMLSQQSAAQPAPAASAAAEVIPPAAT